MNFLSGQTDLMPVPPRLTFCGPLDELQTPLVEYSRHFKWVHNVKRCQDCKWPYNHYLWPFIISVIYLISPQAAQNMELYSAALELSVEGLSQKLQSCMPHLKDVKEKKNETADQFPYCNRPVTLR